MKKTIVVQGSAHMRDHTRTIEVGSSDANVGQGQNQEMKLAAQKDPFSFDSQQVRDAKLGMQQQVAERLSAIVPADTGVTVTLPSTEGPFELTFQDENGEPLSIMEPEVRKSVKQLLGEVDRGWFDAGDSVVVQASDESQTDAKKSTLSSLEPPEEPFDYSEQLAEWMNENDVRRPDGHTTRDWPWSGLDDDWHDYPNEIAFEFDEPVSDPRELVAYYMRADMAMGADGFDGDTPGTPVGKDGDKAKVWVYGVDSTKSRRSDIYEAIEGLPSHMRFGSPVRKTERAGPDTKGTRAVQGVGHEPRIAVR